LEKTAKTNLSVRNVSFRYSDRFVLSNIDLDINHGSFTGLIGPNGSGKSTLLKILNGTLKPDTGSVTIGDTELTSIKKSWLAKIIACVPEETSIAFPFTCMEVVLMGRTPYLKRFEWEKKEDYAIAGKCLELTDTLEFKDRSVEELSSGEKQRVIIARALAQEPSVLLLDEPTSHLDINHQKEIFDLLKRLNKVTGLTIFTVLHDVNITSLYCDEIILINKGRIFLKGKPSEAITANNIKEVYGVNVKVSGSGERPFISIIPSP